MEGGGERGGGVQGVAEGVEGWRGGGWRGEGWRGGGVEVEAEGLELEGVEAGVALRLFARCGAVTVRCGSIVETAMIIGWFEPSTQKVPVTYCPKP